MSWFTLAWILWALAFCVIEGVALVNRQRGDTLSEHMWAWLGIRDDFWHVHRKNDAIIQETGGVPKTPKWTLRLARTVFLSATLWLALHITTGGWV